jgi:hypothetical protein
MTQPEALRLADELDAAPYSSQCTNAAAAELRRLHEVNQELLAALKDLQAAVKSRGVISTVKALAKADAAIAKGEMK